jgi:hypothetical protein
LKVGGVSSEKTDTSDLGSRRNTDVALVVVGGRDSSRGRGGAVDVPRVGRGIIVAEVDVVTALSTVPATELGVLKVNAVINDRDDDTTAVDAHIPDASDVQVDASRAVEVPLGSPEWVVGGH